MGRSYGRAVFGKVLRFDHRNVWFGFGRTIVALATLSELTFTLRDDLLHPVDGTAGPNCLVMHSISLYCIGNPVQYVVLRQGALMLALSLVISGWRPRYTAFLHLWATFSISTSITLPDGGDSIALILVILITPMCLCDDRRWHWNRPTHKMGVSSRALGFASSWAIRAQVSYIYADSAISKMGVAEWADGSAFYYFVRDKMFGSAGPLSGFWWWISSTDLGCVTFTWGTIVLELLIAAWSLLGGGWRKIALLGTIVLHSAIFLAVGLFSFSMVMIGVCLFVANPDVANLLPRKRLGVSQNFCSHSKDVKSGELLAT
jgi:antimicrobial peptide system SdpB family protein